MMKVFFLGFFKRGLVLFFQIIFQDFLFFTYLYRIVLFLADILVGSLEVNPLAVKLLDNPLYMLYLIGLTMYFDVLVHKA